MKLFAFIDLCAEKSLAQKFKKAAEVFFTDDETQDKYRYTAKTIHTWYFRYKKTGIVSVIKRKRKDKGQYRKITPQHLTECLNIALQHFI